MNKIITINLGGIAIQIEEDAYDSLRDYLKSLEVHFNGTDSAEEIMTDIENRIAEMLFNKLKGGKVSINKSDVEEVATTMGKPSELDEGEDSEKNQEEEKVPQNESSSKKYKRLFRDPEDAKVGGVCAGLAKYLDIDVTIVRIIWLIFFFVFGTGLLVYILLWAVLPEPKTAAERLEMVGEIPNVENIKNTIRDEATQAYERIKKSARSENVKSFLDKIISVLITLLTAFAKVFGVLLTAIIAIGLIVFFFRFFSGESWFQFGHNFHFNADEMNSSLVGPASYWVVKISFFLFIAIPVAYLLVRIITVMLGVPKPNKIVRQSVLAVWLMTLITGVAGVFYGIGQIRNEQTQVDKSSLIFNGDTLVVTTSTSSLPKGFYSTDRNIYLDVVQCEEKEAYLEIYKKSRGSDDASAKSGINKLVESYQIETNIFSVQEKIITKDPSLSKLPEMKYTLHVPVGKYVVFNQNTRYILHNIQNKENVFDQDMAGKTFYMSVSGLTCVDCSQAEYNSRNYGSNQSTAFTSIEISDAVRVEIIEDGTNQVIYPKDKEWEKSLEIKSVDGKLTIERNDDLDVVLDWLNKDPSLKLEIHTSNLENLEINGSSEVEYRANSGTKKVYFSIDVEGANTVKVRDLNAEKVSIDAAGANNVTLGGSAKILLMDLAGASKVHGFDFQAESVNADIDGAAHCEISASSEITGEVNGNSKLEYKGSPNVSVHTRGASRVSSVNP
ncbi:MAG: PspC domain-containing protein [Bacteroidetes bacterium]|nr:PspC domain-containing protein [Bacteroidota bacterium]